MSMSATAGLLQLYAVGQRDFSSWNLAGLRSVDLRFADLTQAILTGTNLTDALLERADTCGVRFGEADLLMANLRRVDAQHTAYPILRQP